MANTTRQNIVDSFESSFADKVLIPDTLEDVWLEKAIGKYSFEIERINYDSEKKEFDSALDRYVIDTLGAYMKQYYQEREVSKVNKRASIVTKEISVNGNGSDKAAVRKELEYAVSEARDHTEKQKHSALT